MDELPKGTISVLLEEIQSGNEGSRNELFRLLREYLLGRARAMMASERADHTLNPSALLNEAFLKLIQGGVDRTAENRRQVFAIATLAMRHVLIDHARKKKRDRRDGKLKKTPLDAVINHLEQDNGCDFTDLYEAIEQLGESSPRTREIVDLHFFGGLTFKEIATHLGLAERTVMREWKRARAKLYVQLRNRSDE